MAGAFRCSAAGTGWLSLVLGGGARAVEAVKSGQTEQDGQQHGTGHASDSVHPFTSSLDVLVR